MNKDKGRDRIETIKCPYCKNKHLIKFKGFSVPDRGETMGGQPTHFGLCNTSDKFVMVVIKDEEVNVVG